MIVLIVHGWSTECGHCRYGAGGWASANNPARHGKPILSPDSRVCHGCGETFTHVQREYLGEGRPIPIEPGEVAA